MTYSILKELMMEGKQCPVCHMNVDGDIANHSHYRGLVYAFCSEQCARMFADHPTLYVGKHAVAKQGKALLKCRTITLNDDLNERQQTILQQALSAMMGIVDLNMDGRHIRICYNLLQATSSQIEECIRGIGLELGDAWAQRLTRAWHHFTEETELDNLAAPTTACCNKNTKGG
jgi:YHS domain-containing protein